MSPRSTRKFIQLQYYKLTPWHSTNSPPFSPAPGLNEELVQLLLIRDELHTEQDAMLVDIEDLTR